MDRCSPCRLGRGGVHPDQDGRKCVRHRRHGHVSAAVAILSINPKGIQTLVGTPAYSAPGRHVTTSRCKAEAAPIQGDQRPLAGGHSPSTARLDERCLAPDSGRRLGPPGWESAQAPGARRRTPTLGVTRTDLQVPSPTGSQEPLPASARPHPTIIPGRHSGPFGEFDSTIIVPVP